MSWRGLFIAYYSGCDARGEDLFISDLVFRPAHELAQMICDRQLSATELCDAYLSQISKHNLKPDSICTLHEENAHAWETCRRRQYLFFLKSGLKGYFEALIKRDALIARMDSAIAPWDVCLMPVATTPAYHRCPQGQAITVNKRQTHI